MRCLFLIVNDICDLRCSYCFYTIGYEKRHGQSIKLQEMPSIPDKICEAGFETVIITGGEPLQGRHKSDVFSLMHQLKINGLKVILNTSGVRLSEGDLDNLVDLQLDRIDISIDSHLEDLHNRQRGMFVDTVFTLKGLISRGFTNLATTTVVTKLNAETLTVTIEWLREIGVRDTHIQPVFRLEGSMVKNERYTVYEAMLAIRHLQKTSHNNAYLGLIHNVVDGLPLPQNASCRMGKDYFVCTPLGILTPCFHRFDIQLGNLFRDRPRAIRRVIKANPLTGNDQPICFGWHCVSLFDIPRFWKE